MNESVEVLLAGAYVPPVEWLPLSLEAITGEKTLPGHRAAALVIAAALLRAAPPGSLAGEPMAMLAAGLASEHVRACDHPAVRAQLLATVVNAVTGGGCKRARSPPPNQNARSFGFFFQTRLRCHTFPHRAMTFGDGDRWVAQGLRQVDAQRLFSQCTGTRTESTKNCTVMY